MTRPQSFCLGSDRIGTQIDGVLRTALCPICGVRHRISKSGLIKHVAPPQGEK